MIWKKIRYFPPLHQVQIYKNKVVCWKTYVSKSQNTMRKLFKLYIVNFSKRELTEN